MRKIGALGLLAVLGGCISLAADPPERLLTLTPAVQAAADSAGAGDAAGALAVQVPQVPQRINGTRIPVATGSASLAYLAEAYWVEKPAFLFRSLLAETLRADGARLVLAGGELEYEAATQLGGELAAMDYDAPSATALVRYDAVLRLPDGRVLTRRFEARETGVPAESLSVGTALNRASNQVAAQVAQWVAGALPSG